MRRPGPIALLLLVAALAIAAVGCGGDEEPSGATATDEWAEQFCTAVSSWTDELRQIGGTIDDPSALNTDALEQAARDVSTVTEGFVEEMRALGAPDTESGDDVRESLNSLADTLETEKADIESAVDDLSGLTDIPGAITAIGRALTAMGTAFENALSAVEDADAGGELEDALEQSDACDEIAG
jgi:ABC-type transporter Mla subunit MlaD